MPSFISKLESGITNHFGWLMTAALIIGLVFQPVSYFFAPYIMYGLMVVIYMGFLKTDYHILWKEVKNFKQSLWLTAFCLILLPALIFLIVKLMVISLNLNPAWSTGALLFFACPTAALAPTLALIMKGHFERTLNSLIISSTLAPFTIPLMLQIFAGSTIEINYLEMFIFLIQLIIFPFIASQLTIHFFKKAKEKIAEHAAALSVLTLTTIIAGAVAGLTEKITGNFANVLEGLILAFCCMILAYMIGWYLQPPKASLQDRSTQAILATWPNIGLGIVFAKAFFPGSDILLFLVLCEIPWNATFTPAQIFVRKMAKAK